MGESGDFGINFDIPKGGSAPQAIIGVINARTRELAAFRILDATDFDLSAPGERIVEVMTVEMIDPVRIYADLMQQLSDYDAIRALFASGFTMQLDAMRAVTGPNAKALLEAEIGLPERTIIHGTPLPDFGAGHPDPKPVHPKALMDLIMGPDTPDFGTASDGVDDRNMILGRGIYITPSDSPAILAANGQLAPGYASGISRIARSMPSLRAANRVVAHLGFLVARDADGLESLEDTLDIFWAKICDEEIAGTGSNHVREKDGPRVVLLWLILLAARQTSVADIIVEHWERCGRDYYSRHDYDTVDKPEAEAMMEDHRAAPPNLPREAVGGLTVTAADDFAYTNHANGAHAENQGIRVFFGEEARLVFRLSGTGTAGVAVRVYV